MSEEPNNGYGPTAAYAIVEGPKGLHLVIKASEWISTHCESQQPSLRSGSASQPASPPKAASDVLRSIEFDQGLDDYRRACAALGLR